VLLARHAVFHRGAKDHRSPIMSGILRNLRNLLSKRYNTGSQSEIEISPRALF
jgi:hypothetical protein